MTRFRPHPEVLERRVGEEIVLVHMGRNEIFALNVTAGRLWELLSSGRSRPEAVEQITREFDADERTVDAEAGRLLELLEREALVELDERA